MKTIKGQDIRRIQTIGSMYADNRVLCWVDDKEYYLPVSEILKFDTDFNALKFKIIKKIKHEYLEVMPSGL
jgi:hypothetical protein